MQIESIRKRDGGSIITLGDTSYHFKPGQDPDGPHIAEVTISRHIEQLLAIPEGYRAPDGETPKLPEPGQEKAAVTQDIPDAAVTSEPVRPETDADAGKPAALDKANDDELRAIFLREVGRKPSSRAGRDTLIDQIEAARLAVTA